MSATEDLRSSEESALENNQIVSRVVGKVASGKKQSLWKKFGAAGVVTVILLILALFVGSGFIIPAAISERLIEETDVQYADAVESKILVFQQALESGQVPANTAKRLAQAEVEVGYTEGGEFVTSNKHEGGLSLLYHGNVILSRDFSAIVHSDAGLYKAFTDATYARAAYYYDETAQEVFRTIGTSRDNYTAEDEFGAVVSELIGEGSNISVDNVEMVTRKDENGEESEELEATGATSSKETAARFVAAVSEKNKAENSTLATLNGADALNVADTVAKEQRSSLLFLAFMENVSKMKYGDGNNAKVNEMMDLLYGSETTTVVDVKTGEVVETTGSMVDAPSLYAILSGEKVDTEKVENYASDRILATVENQVGSKATRETLSGTVSSTASKVRGMIGRLVSGEQVASSEALSTVVPTVEKSLVDNGFSTIRGVSGGEMLAEGAVNVGKMLAQASGGTASDGAAVKAYARVTAGVLALDAEVDRMSRSPFDVTSRNTFLGSIVYRFAVAMRGTSGIIRSLGTVANVMNGAVMALLPNAAADDGETMYLTNFGKCATLGNIGAVGSAECTAVISFDTSTLNDTFNDAGFKNFVEANTVLENGVRKIKEKSTLANFIQYNNQRITPIGVTDGGILSSLTGGVSKIPFVSNIVSMVRDFLGASENDRRIASGAAFVNSTTNGDWATYKYAQRYVSLARATATLRQYDGDATAYAELKYFEGAENPVVAFLKEHPVAYRQLDAINAGDDDLVGFEVFHKTFLTSAI